MADYRNAMLSLDLVGLNLVNPPEQLKPGQQTRAVNLRPNVEGIIEGRPTTSNYVMVQPTIDGRTFTYPSFWGTGPLRDIKYIGDVTVNSAITGGYLSIHAGSPLPTGISDSTWRVFLNGAVVRKKTGFATFAVLDPVGLSIVRANASNGIPIIIIDGQWYLVLNELNLGSPPATQNIATGYGTLNNTPTFNAKRLGIPKPAAAPTTAAQGVGLTGTYYHRVSGYDSTTGFQGPPSAASIAFVAAAQGIRVTFTDTNTYGNFSHFRVWRNGGALANTWRLVGSVASTNSGGAIFFDDTISDTNLALEEALDTDSVEIFNTITSAGVTSIAQKFNYAFGPYLGKYVFWVGDPVRKNHIYWNKLADLSRHNPSDDVNAVSDPADSLLNGFIFGNNPFVFSNKRLYALDFGGPESTPAFIPREVPIGIGAAGTYAFAVAPNVVYLCSKDGIYITDCQPGAPINITDETLKPIFRGESRGTVEAVDYNQANSIRMAATNKELHFLYPGKTTGQIQHLVYDLEGKRWLQWTSADIGVVYPNENTTWVQLLMGKVDSQFIRSFDDVYAAGDEEYTAIFRSGAVDLGAPLTNKEFGVLLLDYDPAGLNITINPYYNSELTAGTSLTTGTTGLSGRRTQSFSLNDFYAKSISLEYTWNEDPSLHPRLFQSLLLYREDEEDVVHWEHPPQSLGQGGLYHIKDSHWGIRSNATVNLTITVDGVTDLYTAALPNTNGVRKKIYLEFLPRLGTVWGFKLDSAQPFRIYGEDTVLFAKPWQTDNAYQALTPFSQAGYAAYLRKGGGT